MDEVLEAPTESIPLDTLTKVYIKIRDKRAEMKREFEIKDSELEEQIKQIVRPQKWEIHSPLFKSYSEEKPIQRQRCVGSNYKPENDESKNDLTSWRRKRNDIVWKEIQVDKQKRRKKIM